MPRKAPGGLGSPRARLEAFLETFSSAVSARRSQEGPRRESPTPMVIAGGEPPLTVTTDWLLSRNEISSHVA
jgi:hypothetical protein